MRKVLPLALIVCCLAAAPALGGQTYYLSPDGDDAAEGSRMHPNRTLGAVLARFAPRGGATVVLLDGEYGEMPSLNGLAFEEPVLIRSENPRAAHVQRLKLGGGCRNLVFEGIVFDGRENPRATNVCHADGGCSYLTFRNCVFTHGRGGYDNADALKLNAGVHHVLIENCEIFDGTDEELDILGDTHDIVVRGCVIYHLNKTETDAMASNKEAASRTIFDSNLFANLSPNSYNGGLRFGGSEKAPGEATDMIAINNRFVHTRNRAAFAFVGAKRCLLYGNVFYHHEARAGSNYGFITIYTNYPDSVPPVENDELYVVGNIFYQPGGDMNRVYALISTNPKTFVASGNLYYNAGRPIPVDPFHDANQEAGAIFADPLFAGPLSFEDLPTRAWFDALQPTPEGPRVASREALDTLALPPSLRGLLDTYLTGAGDPWYAAIRSARGGGRS